MQTTHGVSLVRGYAAVTLARLSYYQKPRDWSAHDLNVIEALNALQKRIPDGGQADSHD